MAVMSMSHHRGHIALGTVDEPLTGLSASLPYNAEAELARRPRYIGGAAIAGSSCAGLRPVLGGMLSAHPQLSEQEHANAASGDER
jgi:hypothetical protein